MARCAGHDRHGEMDAGAEQGLIPYLLETSVEGYRETHKMVMEGVLVNPKLEEAPFTRPQPK